MFESQAHHKNIGIILDISPSVKPVFRSDKQRLRQVLVNLVGNAVKFTQQGRVIIKISNTEISTVNGLQIEVIDTGEGIAPGIQPYIFDRFQQADDSVSRKYGGTGLGTSIARHLVELMGGEIGLESKLGKGSRFWFRLPVKVSLRNHNECPTLPSNAVFAIAANDAEGHQRIKHAIDEIGNPDYVIKSLPAHEVTNKQAGFVSAHCIIADCGSLSDKQIGELTLAGRKGDTFYIAYDAGKYERQHLLELGYQQIIRSCPELGNAFVYAASSLEIGARTDPVTYSLPGTDGDHVRRVLVAEDSDMNRQVFKGILGYMGLDVNFANNGVEALKRLKEEVFDLLIVDIQMPGMSGFEVINRCKSLLSGKSRMPIVVVTGDVTKEVKDECKELGVDRFLSKPVESERLRGVVYELLAG